jgi:hypothetical protein
MVFMGDSTTRRLVFHAIYLMMDSSQKLQLDAHTHTIAHCPGSTYAIEDVSIPQLDQEIGWTDHPTPMLRLKQKGETWNEALESGESKWVMDYLDCSRADGVGGFEIPVACTDGESMLHSRARNSWHW